MILNREYMIVGKGGGIVAAVSEIYGPIQHGDFHFLQRPDFSIVITYIFHSNLLLICNPLFFIFIPDNFIAADK